MVMRVLLSFVAVVWVSQGIASDKGFQLGQKIAAEHAPCLPTSPDAVPQFKGTDLPQSQYSPETLTDQARAMTQTSEAGLLLLEVSREKIPYQLTADNPIIVEADKIVKDPLKVIEAVEDSFAKKKEMITSLHTCQESSQSFEVSFTRHLSQVRLIEKRQEFSHSRYWTTHDCCEGRYYNLPVRLLPSQEKQLTWVNGRNWHRDWAWNVFNYHRRDVLFHIGKGEIEKELSPWTSTTSEDWKKGVEEPFDAVMAPSNGEGGLFPHDVWVGGEEFEPYLNKAICTLSEHKCVAGEETRNIHNASIKRPCWAEQVTYACEYPSINTCQELRKQGCLQINGHCLQKIGANCALWEYQFQCTSEKQGLEGVSLKGKTPFCLDGSCVDTLWAPNGDMAEVLSKLAIFNSMAKDMDAENARVFRGRTEGCVKHKFGFTDCCRSLNGWGISMKMSKCTPEELRLSQLRAAKKCVAIGTYCAEKVGPVCIRHRTNFCCFESQLSRIVHEQGRAQLGIGWGTAKEPQCRALTIDELSRIDFEKLDLSELIHDLMASAKIPDTQAMGKQFLEDWKQRLPQFEAEKNKGNNPNLLIPLKEKKFVPPAPKLISIQMVAPPPRIDSPYRQSKLTNMYQVTQSLNADSLVGSWAWAFDRLFNQEIASGVPGVRELKNEIGWDQYYQKVVRGESFDKKAWEARIFKGVETWQKQTKAINRKLEIKPFPIDTSALMRLDKSVNKGQGVLLEIKSLDDIYDAIDADKKNHIPDIDKLRKAIGPGRVNYLPESPEYKHLLDEVNKWITYHYTPGASS